MSGAREASDSSFLERSSKHLSSIAAGEKSLSRIESDIQRLQDDIQTATQAKQQGIAPADESTSAAAKTKEQVYLKTCIDNLDGNLIKLEKAKLSSLEIKVQIGAQEKDFLSSLKAIEIGAYTLTQTDFAKECEVNLLKNSEQINKIKNSYFDMLINKIELNGNTDDPFINKQISIAVNLIKNLVSEYNKKESDPNKNSHKERTITSLVESISSLDLTLNNDKLLSLLKEGCKAIAVQSILINPNDRDMAKASEVQRPEKILKEGVQNKYLGTAEEHLKSSLSGLSNLYQNELHQIKSQSEQNPQTLNRLIASISLLMLEERNSDTYYKSDDQIQKVKAMNNFITHSESLLSQKSNGTDNKLNQLILNLINFMAALENIRDNKFLSKFKSKGKWAKMVYEDILPLIPIINVAQEAKAADLGLLLKENFDKAIDIQAQILAKEKEKENRAKENKTVDPKITTDIGKLRTDLSILFAKCNFEPPTIKPSLSSVGSGLITPSQKSARGLPGFAMASKTHQSKPSLSTSSMLSSLAQAKTVSVSASASKFDLACAALEDEAPFIPTKTKKLDHANIKLTSAVLTASPTLVAADEKVNTKTHTGITLK